MSDSTSIYNNSYAIQGMLTGGIIGGAGGVLAAGKGYGFSSKPDLDKILEQQADTFKNQYKDNKSAQSVLKKIQEWAEKIKNAGIDYGVKAAIAIEEYKTQNPSIKDLTEEDISKAIKSQGLEASKEEFIEATKTKAKAEIEPLLEKLKTPNKIKTSLISGLILGIIGLIGGTAIKKEQ